MQGQPPVFMSELEKVQSSSFLRRTPTQTLQIQAKARGIKFFDMCFI
jgi:hypothetical protein